jgi:hypothetical protein
MNSALDQWLASCARASGTLGCGVQLPDRTCVSRSFNEGFPQTHLDETLRCLAELSPAFAGHGLFPRWFAWTFEGGQIRVVLRADGALLALAAQIKSPAAETLDALTGEFLALQLPD